MDKWRIVEVMTREANAAHSHALARGTGEYHAITDGHRVVFAGRYARLLADAFVDMMTRNAEGFSAAGHEGELPDRGPVPAEMLVVATARAQARARDDRWHQLCSPEEHAAHAAEYEFAYGPFR